MLLEERDEPAARLLRRCAAKAPLRRIHFYHRVGGEGHEKRAHGRQDCALLDFLEQGKVRDCTRGRILILLEHGRCGVAESHRLERLLELDLIQVTRAVLVKLGEYGVDAAARLARSGTQGVEKVLVFADESVTVNVHQRPPLL